MWEIPHVAFSTLSQALQANPSLSRPIGGMASPRAVGEPRATFLALAAGKASPGCCVQWCEWPCVPMSLLPDRAYQRHQRGSPATSLPPGVCPVPSSPGLSKPAAIAQCPSRQRKMGEDVLMVAWVRCVLAACTPRGSDGISALNSTPSSYPSHHRAAPVHVHANPVAQ